MEVVTGMRVKSKASVSEAWTSSVCAQAWSVGVGVCVCGNELRVFFCRWVISSVSGWIQVLVQPVQSSPLLRTRIISALVYVKNDPVTCGFSLGWGQFVCVSVFVCV